MFGRKSAKKPEETPTENGAEESAPAEDKPAPRPAPSGSGSNGKKVNLAAKKALLKAYYRSSGYSEEQIQQELARIAGEEGVAATIPGAPPPPAAGSIEDLESQVREIGKLAGDTILKMEEQISGLLSGAGAAAADDSRLDNLQEQINTIYENQQTAYQSLTELTGNVGTLTGQVGELRVQAESAPDTPAPAQDSGLEERLTAITEGLARRISALEEAPTQSPPPQDSGLEERMTAITGGMGERISAMEERLRDLQTKLDEFASKEPAPAEGAADGELARKVEELAAKMAAEADTVEKMQEKIDEIRRKEGKTLSEIERHVADQLRVTMEGVNENLEELRSETSVPQIKEELEKKIGVLEDFQEGTLPALEEVKSSAAEIRTGLIAAIDECLEKLDEGRASDR